jgi:hypothetical protein
MREVVQLDQNCKCGIGFDYGVIADADAAARIRAAADNIHAKVQRTKTAIIEIGKQLIKVKYDLLNHGQFGEWLKAEFDWDVRTARNYMSVAESFGDKTEIISVLKQATLYALAAPSTPETIRSDVIAKLEAGQQIDDDAVHTAVQEARAHARRERAEAKLTPNQRKRKGEKRDKRERARLEAEQRRARECDEARRAAAAWTDKVGTAAAAELIKLYDQNPYFFDELRKQVAAAEQQEPRS